MRHDRLEVRERLGVRARAGGLARGGRSFGEQRLDIPGLGGVVQQPAAVRPPAPAQLGNHRAVEQLPPQRRQALLDRPPRELVPEAERAVAAQLDQPRRLGLRERVQGSERSRELGRDRGRDHGQALQRVLAGGAEQPHARQHRVLDVRRDLVGRRRERLGHEERVAAGERVDGVGVASGARGEVADRGPRERRELEPVHGRRGQHAQQAVERMPERERVVAQGQHEQGGQ